MNISKTTAAYIAGFIDGEGSIGIRINKTKNNYPSVRLRITNTDYDIMDWFHKSYGGSLYTRTFPNQYKTAYTWTLENSNLLPFLQKIQPYLTIKRPQADLAIRREKLKKFTINRGHLGLEYPEWVRKELQEICVKLKTLNKRGKLLHAERLSKETS